jgi:hypothetical protein
MFWSVDACKSPGPQTLLARLPSRLSDRTDSTDLLIRNRHLAHDPPRLPKDASVWSIAQCYETQPLLISLLNLDIQTLHLAIMTSFDSTAPTLHHEFVRGAVRSTLTAYTITTRSRPIPCVEDVRHSISSQSESNELSGNLFDWSQAKGMKNTPCAGLVST